MDVYGQFEVSGGGQIKSPPSLGLGSFIVVPPSAQAWRLRCEWPLVTTSLAGKAAGRGGRRPRCARAGTALGLERPVAGYAQGPAFAAAETRRNKGCEPESPIGRTRRRR